MTGLFLFIPTCDISFSVRLNIFALNCCLTKIQLTIIRLKNCFVMSTLFIFIFLATDLVFVSTAEDRTAARMGDGEPFPSEIDPNENGNLNFGGKPIERRTFWTKFQIGAKA